MAATIPGPDNGFLKPGTECECDLDFRCANHDEDAEQAYWMAQFRSAPAAVVIDVGDPALAYEAGDPKIFDLDKVAS